MRTPRVLASTAIGAAGVAALVIGSAGAASADTVVTGGTTTISVPAATAAAAVKAGIVATVTDPATATYNQQTSAIDASFPVTGGTADVATFTGTLEQGGSVVFANYSKKKKVTITDLTLDFTTNQISGVLSGTSAPVTLFDLGGQGSFSINGQTQTYSATEVDVDPAGATALDSALKTSYFTAGQNLGSFTTTFTQTVTGEQGANSWPANAERQVGSIAG